MAPGPIWTPLQPSGGTTAEKLIRWRHPAELAASDARYSAGQVYGAADGKGQSWEKSSQKKLIENLHNHLVVLYLQPNGCIMMERRDVFQAIVDPTRRMIIQKLSGGVLNIGQLVEDSGITRQGIAKHLKVLNECGLITLTQKGRQQLCEARLDQLSEVVDWVNESRKLWTQRFEKLDNFLVETKQKQMWNQETKNF